MDKNGSKRVCYHAVPFVHFMLHVGCFCFAAKQPMEQATQEKIPGRYCTMGIMYEIQIHVEQKRKKMYLYNINCECWFFPSSFGARAIHATLEFLHAFVWGGVRASNNTLSKLH